MKPGAKPTAKPAAAKPASRAVAKAAPVATRSRPAERAPAPVHHHYQPPPTLDKSTKVGLGVAGGFAVVVLIVVFVVMNKKADERKARDAYEREIGDLHAQLVALDVNDEAGAQQLLELAEAKEARWKGHELAKDIQALVSKATTSLETGKSRREVLTAFTEIEETLKNSEGISPETVKDMRRRLDELEVKVSLGGPELLARFSLARGTVDKVYATRLLDDARAFDTANPDNARLTLSRYQVAEDEIKTLLDRAFHDRNDELKAYYTPLYQQAIGESDRLVNAIFTAEGDKKLPSTDCLSSEQAKNWNPSGVKGFSHRVENGVLQLVGPDADAGQSAVISIGDREQWRHYIVDLELVVEKGNPEIYFRLGRSPNANTLSYILDSEGEGADIQVGKTYQAKASVLGSKFIFRFAGEDLDTPPVYEETASWAKNRKGAIGLLIPPGARIRFTKFLVRELR